MCVHHISSFIFASGIIQIGRMIEGPFYGDLNMKKKLEKYFAKEIFLVTFPYIFL